MRANVFTRVNGILFVLFCLVVVTGHLLQGAFGLLIIANSIVGIVQELRAKRTLDNLAVVGEAHPIVLRDGERRRISRDEVVLDDLIAVAPGDQVVVDGAVVAADYLELDESLLTGEADPVSKRPGDPVLSGAYVIAGTGTYRAEKVGADAYAAQLTEQAAKFTLVSSELRQGINKILRIVSYLLFPVGALAIYVQFNQPDTTWQESVLRMVAVLVPMVPEGLVLLTSMAFALGIIRLGRRQCLVNELPAIFTTDPSKINSNLRQYSEEEREKLRRKYHVEKDKTMEMVEAKKGLFVESGTEIEDNDPLLEEEYDSPDLYDEDEPNDENSEHEN